MVTYYTCTEVTPEMYEAYLKYKPSDNPFSLEDMQAVTLCSNHGSIITYPVCPPINERHQILARFTITQQQRGLLLEQ